MLKLVKKSNQAGVTLLETILVLSLIAIIMVGGLNLYNNANNGVKANRAIQQVSAFSTNIRQLFTSAADYSDIDGNAGNADLISAGAVPQDMVAGAAAIRNAFGGTVNLSSVAGASGIADSSFEIEFQGVPEEVCYKIVTAELASEFVSNATGCTSTTATCLDRGADLTDAANICGGLNASESLFFTYN
ncbi:MAG: prepilin-type N-terminal cleavage/methylation domain-containing protein [Alphaproteobacteria bacterium]|jgi:type II secretory pathway pseudopilin PulG|nr:prepilin-type N-terminal cleavage/methylation domain-containing protein [Alphaproteobacteria bacterium]